jgi:hypothetical protein
MARGFTISACSFAASLLVALVLATLAMTGLASSWLSGCATTPDMMNAVTKLQQPATFNWRESIPHLQAYVLLYERLEGKRPFISWGSGAANRSLEHANEPDGKNWFATRAMPNNYFREQRFESMNEAIEWLLEP